MVTRQAVVDSAAYSMTGVILLINLSGYLSINLLRHVKQVSILRQFRHLFVVL